MYFFGCVGVVLFFVVGGVTVGGKIRMSMMKMKIDKDQNLEIKGGLIKKLVFLKCL